MEHVETYTRNGLTIEISYDMDAENPTTWGMYEVTSDLDSYLTDSGKLTPAIRARLKAGTAFWYDVYEHGGTSYTLSGEGMNDRWDTTNKAGLILLSKDITDYTKTYETRQVAARDCLEEYTAWANGEVYGYMVYDDSTHEHELVESCWGFIGDVDYCKSQANEVADYYRIPRRSNPASGVHV